MTSTVVDAGVFLLLVSASVVALLGAGDPTGGSPPAPDAGVLATTATVVVDPDTAHPDAHGSTELPSRKHRIHGSFRRLIARGTVAEAGIDGEPLDPHGVALRQAVERELESRLDARTQVVASFEPVAGSEFRGELTAGTAPPPGESVRTTVVSVPTSLPPVTPSDPSSTRAFATAFVDRRLPPAEVRASLRGSDADAAYTAARYAQAADLVFDDGDALAGTLPREANTLLAAALRELLAETDPTAASGSPSADADSAGSPSADADSAGTPSAGGAAVRIVVRRW